MFIIQRQQRVEVGHPGFHVVLKKLRKILFKMVVRSQSESTAGTFTYIYVKGPKVRCEEQGLPGS